MHRKAQRAELICTGEDQPIVIEESTCSIPLQSPQAQQLRDAAVLILDEITKLHRYSTEALDWYLKVLMNSDLSFGGKIVIVAGDGRQTLPIVRRGSRSDIVDSFIFMDSCGKI